VPRPTQLARIRVAAGILRDSNGRVLIAQRTGDHAFAGFWEFPGGKIKRGEDPVTALRREFGEELGIEVLGQTPFMRLAHDYADRSVCIDFYLIDAWANTPEGRDGQALRWVRPDRIAGESLLPADGPVLEALRGLK
jgi:8-oxo-dGTP diphosphatase